MSPPRSPDYGRPRASSIPRSIKRTPSPPRSLGDQSRENILDLASPEAERRSPAGVMNVEPSVLATDKAQSPAAGPGLDDDSAMVEPAAVASRLDTPGISPRSKAESQPLEPVVQSDVAGVSVPPDVRPETPEIPPPPIALPVEESSEWVPVQPTASGTVDTSPQATESQARPQSPPEPMAVDAPVSLAGARVRISSPPQSFIEESPATIIPPSLPKPLPIPDTAPGPKTIAERRLVHLQPTASTTPSPFDDRTPRNDSVPTEESNAETVDDRPEQVPVEHDVPEEIKRLKMVAAIRLAQQQDRPLDVAPIYQDNDQVSPEESTRVPSETNPLRRNHFRGPTWPLNHTEAHVSKLVTVHLEREKLQQVDKVAQLKADYLRIDKQWKEQCRALDASMDLRGPPPPELYATPNAIPLVGTPAAGPGIAPTTPGDEAFSARANRRRGAGDAVATEAEFQEVLLSLQDTAARDPTFRASKTTAVVPDMILDEEKRLRYDDENDLVSDPIAFYDYYGNAEPEWSDEERVIFLRRYLNHPKQFGKIAEGIPNKEAGDCVLYYYRTKKTIDYKGMLASRRGDRKRKVLPIKKGGKSSALLADLERKKPTVDRTHPQGPKSHITPAKSRDLLTARQRLKDGTATPASSGGRDDDVDSSAAPSRAGSEAPSGNPKAKMRMTMKTVKRPRMSSNPGSVDLTSGIPPLSSGAPGDAHPADLLPPVKRAGKRRKVDPADPNAPEDAKPSRRNATNSYWSVEDKRRVKELFKVHNGDTRAIAAELEGKSERQVSNYYDAHKAQIDVPDDTEAPADVGATAQVSSLGMCFESLLTPLQLPSVHAPRPAVRSIYDTPSFHDRQTDPRYREGPQLGTFPSPYRSTPPLPVFPEPPKPAPRLGGMPLSSMLNNDSTEDASRPGSSGRYPRFEDNASDATVSERDGENSLTRPSPRSALSALAASPLKAAGRLQPTTPEDRRRSSFGGVVDRPDLDRHWISRPYEPPRPAWLPRDSSAGVDARAFPPRPSTVAPANPYYAQHSSPWALDRVHTPPPLGQREYLPPHVHGGHGPEHDRRPLEYPVPHIAPHPPNQGYRRSESPQKWQYGPTVPPTQAPGQQSHPVQPPPHNLPPIPTLPPISQHGDRDVALPPLRGVRPSLESHKST